MKNILLMLCLLLCPALAARAQVSVELLMADEQFLPGEAIPIRIRVVNRSGQPIHFGDESWVKFSVEAKDGSVVQEFSGEPEVAHGFDVQPSEMATTKAADIAPFYKMEHSGRYAVTATVHVTAWNKDYTSKPKFFNLVHGNKIWDQEFGVPQPTNSTAAPEVRKYALQQVSMLNKLNLYLKITDPSEERTYRVVTLGTMISFSNPQPQLDTMNNLHLLYQEAAQKYRYVVLNCDGDILIRQTYLYSENVPHMKTDSSGNISLEGGSRYFAANDIPPHATPNQDNAAPPSNQ